MKNILALLMLIFCVYFVFQVVKSKDERMKKQEKIEKEKENIRSTDTFVDIKCYCCEGKKHLYDRVNKRNRVCYVCKGMGKRRHPRLMEDQAFCKICRGMGKMLKTGRKDQPIGYEKCRECRGKGVVTLD